MLNNKTTTMYSLWLVLLSSSVLSHFALAEPELPTQQWCDEAALSYNVTKVAADDVLFIRKGPGTKYTKVGSIPPDGMNVKVTGPATLVGKARWVPIDYQQVTGWVNRGFLTADCFGEGLYNIPVTQYLPLELDAFQLIFDEAVKLASPWTQNPLQVALQFLGEFKGHTQLISQSYDSIEAPNAAEIIVIRDGLLNAAVRGERYRLRLQKQVNTIEMAISETPLEQIVWQLNSAEHTWRCWTHRGHTEFATKACK